MPEIRDMDEKPVTVIIKRQPKADRVDEFEKWLTGRPRGQKKEGRPLRAQQGGPNGRKGPPSLYGRTGVSRRSKPVTYLS